MRTPVELRNDAMQCLRMAEEAKARGHKAALLILAQGWAGMADQMEKMPPTDEAEAKTEVPALTN
jgi:hypothetical protein